MVPIEPLPHAAVCVWVGGARFTLKVLTPDSMSIALPNKKKPRVPHVVWGFPPCHHLTALAALKRLVAHNWVVFFLWGRGEEEGRGCPQEISGFQVVG